MILYKNRLKPEQYALVEQAENRIRARLGRRVDRAEVLAEMARLVLSAGESRTRVRYQVYLHVDGVTGEGWLDTDRGRLPAPPEVVQEALRQGHVCEVRGEAAATPNAPADLTVSSTEAAMPDFEGSVSQSPEPQGIADPQSSDRKIESPRGGGGEPETGSGRPGGAGPAPGGARRRKALPVGVLSRLYERTRGRCEDCGRRVPLDSDHLDFYSENPVHDPDRMLLRCRACHALRHEPHFQARPGWARAREQARRRRSGG